MHRETTLPRVLPDTLLYLNHQGICLDFQLISRQTPEASSPAIGKSIDEFFSKSFVDQFHRCCDLALQSGTVQTWEYELWEEHQTHLHEARLAPLGNDQVVVIIRDITHRKRDDEVLHHSEHYYKHLIHNLQVGVLIQSASGEILLSNLGAQRLLQVSESQLLGKRLTEIDVEITGEADTLGVKETLHEHLCGGKPLYNLVLCVYHHHSEYRAWMLVNVVPELDAEGVVQYVVVTLSDITDFKNMAAALRTSEEQYEFLVNSISEVLFLIDIEGCWLFLNAAWETVTGYRPLECLGIPVETSVDPQDKALIENAFTQLVKREVTDCHLEIRLITRDKGLRWGEMRLQLVFNETEHPIGYTGTLTDITERKANEEHLFQLAVKSKIVEMQRQLLAAISHDIRTPLSVISTSSYMLQRQLAANTEFQRYFDNIEEQIHLLKQILEKTSMVAQLIYGSVQFSYAKAQVNDLIRDVVAKNEGVILQKQHTIHLYLKPDIQQIVIDQKWVTEMLDNLLKNSIRYTPANGVITITTEAVSNCINITVKDSGVGIDSDDLQHIFEPFYKGDKARSEIHGTFGLGLSIVNAVIQAHGGSVSIESKIGEGTKVLLRFPANANDYGTYDAPHMLKLV